MATERKQPIRSCDFFQRLNPVKLEVLSTFLHLDRNLCISAD